MNIRKLFAAVGLLGLLASGHAMADWSWTFDNNAGGTWTYGSSSTDGSPNVDVTASGWRNTRGNNDGKYGTGKLEPYQLGVWSWGSSNQYGGLGVNDGPSPQHGVDNDGRIDSVLLSFGQAVELSDVSFGWAYRDSDFTLAAYTGADPAAGTQLGNYNYRQLTSNGWSLVTGSTTNGTGSYDGTGSPNTYTVNNSATPIASSYWLISALNPKLSGRNGLDAKDDYFKLKAVGAKAPPSPSSRRTPSPPSIPEPSALPLLLGGLLMAGYLRHRRVRKTASLSA